MKIDVKLCDKIIDTIEIPDFYVQDGILGTKLTELYGNYGWTGFKIHKPNESRKRKDPK